MTITGLTSMAALFGVVIGLVVTLLFNLAAHIGSMFFSTIFLDVSSSRMVEVFTVNGIDLYSNISAVSMSLVTIFLLFNVITSLMQTMKGKEAPNPLVFLFRAGVSIVLILLWRSIYDQIFVAIFNAFRYALAPLSGDLMTTGSFVLPVTLDVSYSGIYLVLGFSVVAMVFKAGITFIERWLSLMATLLIGPFCIALGSLPSSEESMKTWLQSLVTQLLGFLLIMIFVQLYNGYVGGADIDLGSIINIGGYGEGDFTGLQNIVLGMVCLTLISNTEKILNVIGFKTLSFGETAKSALVGAGAAIMTVKLAGDAAGAVLGVPPTTAITQIAGATFAAEKASGTIGGAILNGGRAMAQTTVAIPRHKGNTELLQTIGGSGALSNREKLSISEAASSNGAGAGFTLTGQTLANRDITSGKNMDSSMFTTGKDGKTVMTGQALDNLKNQTAQELGYRNAQTVKFGQRSGFEQIVNSRAESLASAYDARSSIGLNVGENKSSVTVGMGAGSSIEFPSSYSTYAESLSQSGGFVEHGTDGVYSGAVGINAAQFDTAMSISSEGFEVSGDSAAYVAGIASSNGKIEQAYEGVVANVDVTGKDGSVSEEAYLFTPNKLSKPVYFAEGDEKVSMPVAGVDTEHYRQIGSQYAYKITPSEGEDAHNVHTKIMSLSSAEKMLFTTVDTKADSIKKKKA